MDDSMKRLHSITKNFWHLHGLHGVAIGMALMMAGALELTGAIAPSRFFSWPLLFIICTLLLCSPMIRRYYSARFGTVIPPARQDQRVRAISVLAGAALGLVMVLYESGHLRGLPFQPFALMCGFLLLLLGFPPRRHYIGLGLVVISFSFLPAFYQAAGEQARHGGVMLLVGMVLMLGGLIDHGILLRGLPRVEREERHA